MICESLVKADPFIFVPGRVVDPSISGTSTVTHVPTRMSQTPHDMHAYWRCTDYIWRRIQHSTERELQPARYSIQRVLTRDLYVCAGESLLTPKYAQILKNLGSKVALEHIACNLVTMVEDMNDTNTNNANNTTGSTSAGSELGYESPVRSNTKSHGSQGSQGIQGSLVGGIDKKSQSQSQSQPHSKPSITVSDITCSFVKMGYGTYYRFYSVVKMVCDNQ